MPVKHVRLRRALVYPLQSLFSGDINKDGQEMDLLPPSRKWLDQLRVTTFLTGAHLRLV
jgi:hypothetical protein